jgi:hypothetical protein
LERLEGEQIFIACDDCVHLGRHGARQDWKIIRVAKQGWQWNLGSVDHSAGGTDLGKHNLRSQSFERESGGKFSPLQNVVQLGQKRFTQEDLKSAGRHLPEQLSGFVPPKKAGNKYIVVNDRSHAGVVLP